LDSASSLPLDFDLRFWQSIYKFNCTSGGGAANGWITAFFPYKQDRQGGRAVRPRMVLYGKDQEDLDGMIHPGDARGWESPHFSAGSFPSGLSAAPFRWDYLDRSFDMEFLGGFVGVAQDQETLTLRPEIGWAVREAPTSG
jgi:hypothetical protein